MKKRKETHRVTKGELCIDEVTSSWLQMLSMCNYLRGACILYAVKKSSGLMAESKADIDRSNSS
jgi:hypothetical protein